MFTHNITADSGLFKALSDGLESYCLPDEAERPGSMAFAIGDVICFIERDRLGRYPGNRICVKIKDITHIGGSVILSIERCDRLLPIPRKKRGR